MFHDLLSIQMFVHVFGGNIDIGLCHQYIAVRCRSKRCQFLADSLSQRRSAHDAIGNIRTDLHPQFHQILQCAPKIKQTVHSF